MSFSTNIMIFIVATLHVLFFVLEKFIWNTPMGFKIFRMSAEQANYSSVLAANQGVYNLLLALGLFGALASGGAEWSTPIKIFILLFIVIAGIYGGITVGKNIIFIQVIPAFIALVLCFLLLAEPKINDITTSFTSPPNFITMPGEEKQKDYDSNFSSLQRKYYPYIAPVLLASSSKEEAFRRVLKLINVHTNWKVMHENIDTGHIEANDTFGMFRYTDQISIDLVPSENHGILVHMRSRSQVGKSDFGKNAKRISSFLQLVHSDGLAN